MSFKTIPAAAFELLITLHQQAAAKKRGRKKKPEPKEPPLPVPPTVVNIWAIAAQAPGKDKQRVRLMASTHPRFKEQQKITGDHSAAAPISTVFHSLASFKRMQELASEEGGLVLTRTCLHGGATVQREVGNLYTTTQVSAGVLAQCQMVAFDEVQGRINKNVPRFERDMPAYLDHAYDGKAGLAIMQQQGRGKKAALACVGVILPPLRYRQKLD